MSNHFSAAMLKFPPSSGPYATYACIDRWVTDFRADPPKIDIPVLAIHGTADRVLAFEVTAARLRDERLIADLTVVAIDDGSHNVGWTHPHELNSALLSFLGPSNAQPSGEQAGPADLVSGS
jgi:non-heme chloroperoxidase